MLSFVIIIARMAGRGYADAVHVVADPFVSIILILAFLSVTLHMRIGMQVIIEDYVHEEGPKIGLLMLNTFFSIALGLACAFAILKMSFGG